MATKHKITLIAEERGILNNIIKTRSSISPQVRRSYMLLAADENGDKQWTDKRICSCYGCSISTLERLRRRLVEDSFEIALYGKKREPAAAKVLDGRVAALELQCFTGGFFQAAMLCWYNLSSYWQGVR